MKPDEGISENFSHPKKTIDQKPPQSTPDDPSQQISATLSNIQQINVQETATFINKLSRYELGREIAQGGMGIFFKLFVP